MVPRSGGHCRRVRFGLSRGIRRPPAAVGIASGRRPGPWSAPARVDETSRLPLGRVQQGPIGPHKAKKGGSPDPHPSPKDPPNGDRDHREQPSSLRWGGPVKPLAALGARESLRDSRPACRQPRPPPGTPLITSRAAPDGRQKKRPDRKPSRPTRRRLTAQALVALNTVVGLCLRRRGLENRNRQPRPSGPLSSPCPLPPVPN